MKSLRASTVGSSEHVPAARTLASVLFALSATCALAGPRAGNLEEPRGVFVAAAQYALAIPLLFLVGLRGATWGTVGHRASHSFRWYDVVSGEKQRDVALLDN